jgi:hypothetical protein
MLEQHPLWDCFVTPGVVALAARQNRGSDPVSEFEKWVNVSLSSCGLTGILSGGR